MVDHARQREAREYVAAREAEDEVIVKCADYKVYYEENDGSACVRRQPALQRRKDEEGTHETNKNQIIPPKVKPSLVAHAA